MVLEGSDGERRLTEFQTGPRDDIMPKNEYPQGHRALNSRSMTFIVDRNSREQGASERSEL